MSTSKKLTVEEAVADEADFWQRVNSQPSETVGKGHARSIPTDILKFERRLLGRYIETFEKFAATVTRALEQTAKTAEQMQAFSRSAELLVQQAPRESAVLQCYQNVSWINGVRCAEHTSGHAIVIGPERFVLEFPILVSGPLEIVIMNQGGSFLVMTSVKHLGKEQATGSLIRYCAKHACIGQLITVTCNKPTLATMVEPQPQESLAETGRR